MDRPDETRTDDGGFAALWSSDGATRSFSPSATGTGLPADLPFLFSPGQRFGPYLMLHAIPMALFAAGAVWAILHPSRSIQDRVAGTWIVPR